jgi:hypothetical protein
MRSIAVALAVSFVMGCTTQSPLLAEAKPLRVQAMQVDSRAIAMKHLDNHQYTQAALMLKRHVNEHPEDLEATFSLAKALYRDHDYDSAKGYISQLETIAPNAPDTLEAKSWIIHDPAFTRTAEQRQKDASLAVLALSVYRGELPKTLITQTPIMTPQPAIEVAPLPAMEAPLVMQRMEKKMAKASPTSRAPLLQANTTMPEQSSSSGEEALVPARQPIQPDPALVKDAPKKGDDIAEMKALMKQMMMMQMMRGASNSNPFAAMQGDGGASNPTSSFMNPMMMQMMQQQGNAPTAQNAQSAQFMQQMMQQSMMQNMNNMFNQGNDNNQNNGGGFGF